MVMLNLIAIGQNNSICVVLVNVVMCLNLIEGLKVHYLRNCT